MNQNQMYMPNMLPVPSSDKIDDLPIQQQQMNATEYARIAPLINQEPGKKPTKRSLKKYLFIAIFFVLISMNLLDKIILGMVPSLENFGYVLTIIKALVFVIGLYILDNLLV